MTVTTVGYGDVVPHNPAGRIVGAILMLLGIGFISLLTATIASTFIASDEEEDTRLDELVETVRRIEQRLDQLGSNRSGSPTVWPWLVDGRRTVKSH